jgi:hypothetical protein
MSDSEEWRHYCEALTVSKMPSLGDRRAYLYGRIDDRGTHRDGVLQRRGEAAVKRLEATLKAIWYAKQ